MPPIKTKTDIDYGSLLNQSPNYKPVWSLGGTESATQHQKSALEKAQDVARVRQEEYGTPLNNMAMTAKLWSPILGIEVTPQQVAICMILLKISRETHLHQDDNIVDIAGYANMLERCYLDAE